MYICTKKQSPTQIQNQGHDKYQLRGSAAPVSSQRYRSGKTDKWLATAAISRSGRERSLLIFLVSLKLYLSFWIGSSLLVQKINTTASEFWLYHLTSSVTLGKLLNLLSFCSTRPTKSNVQEITRQQRKAFLQCLEQGKCSKYINYYYYCSRLLLLGRRRGIWRYFPRSYDSTLMRDGFNFSFPKGTL